MYQSDFDKALEFHKAGKFLEAMPLYTEHLAKHPRHVDALNNRGCVKDDLGDLDGAFEDLFKVIKIDPHYAKAYANLGYLYKKKKMYNIAILYYTRSINLYLENKDVYSGRGCCYEELQRLNDALKDYSKAIALDPKNSGNFYSRARIYIKKEVYELAYNDYISATKLLYPTYNPNELVTLVKPDHLDLGAIAYEKLICTGFGAGYMGDINKGFLLYPVTSDRTLLRPENLHISKTYKRHLRQQGYRYKLLFDSDFDAIMDSIFRHYEEENAELPITRCFFTALNRKTASHRVISAALYKDGRLVAGDLGMQIGKVYKSFTGYHDEPYSGTVQLILIARYLAENGFVLWDFGPSTARWDAYKLRLGCEKMTTEAYLSLFSSINSGSEKIYKKNKKSGKTLYDFIHV